MPNVYSKSYSKYAEHRFILGRWVLWKRLLWFCFYISCQILTCDSWVGIASATSEQSHSTISKFGLLEVETRGHMGSNLFRFFLLKMSHQSMRLNLATAERHWTLECSVGIDCYIKNHASKIFKLNGCFGARDLVAA